MFNLFLDSAARDKMPMAAPAMKERCDLGTSVASAFRYDWPMVKPTRAR